ncbi:MAG: TolC family protein, partial [Bdellovibrionales bacterium]|nr:TolC family protein [Bdellovibrionales bacterium]
PLFDISQLAEYQIARKQKLMTQFEIEKFERRIEREWELVKANLTRALDSARERQKSLQMAQALYQDNLRRLRAGRSNLNDIVVDQNRLAEAEILAINGWAKAHLLYASFCHLRGEKLNEESPNCL